uniref:Uncharacterized protein n=1 Tax=Fagus sylvatica TaxID=28930 RepID=A0A2N9I3H8_FAGSY
MAPGSRGVGAVFVCTFPVKIPVKRGMLSANREFHVVAWSRYLSNAPGLADQLVASRKDSAREGGCPGEKMRFAPSAFFLKSCPSSRAFRIRGNPSLGFVRYGPANRGHRGVFGPFEDSFPIRIPARPGKILGDPRVPRRAWMCLLSNVPGLADQLVASQEDSARKRGNVGGENSGNFQHSLISSACFHARGRRSSRCRISTILVSSESLRYLLFKRYRPCTEASLGSQDMILRTEAVGMFLMPRGHLLTLRFRLDRRSS